MADKTPPKEETWHRSRLTDANIPTPPTTPAPPRSTPRRRRKSAEAILEKGTNCVVAATPTPPALRARRMRHKSADSFVKETSYKLTPLPPLQPSRIPPPAFKLTPPSTPPPPPVPVVTPTWDDDDVSVNSSAPTKISVVVPTVSRRVARQVSLPNFSPTKKLRLPPRPKPEELHALLLGASGSSSGGGGGGGGEGNDGNGSVSSSARAADSRASKVAMHRVNHVLHLYERYRRKGFGEDELLTFPRVLKREFPLASGHEIDAMIGFVQMRRAADAARRAKAARRWSADEKRALERLFRAVDADGSGAISLAEFEELAALANLSRAELRLAYERAAESAAGPHGELGLARFLGLVEGLSDESIESVRAILPGLLDAPTLADGSEGALLVFDDGRQQLWRLDKECSRELVRKETREAEWQAALLSGRG